MPILAEETSRFAPIAGRVEGLLKQNLSVTVGLFFVTAGLEAPLI